MIFIVMCISTGLLLFTWHSTEFHLFGFILVMFASLSTGLRWTLAQAVTQKKELGLSNPIDMIYHIQPSMIICLLPLAIGVEGISLLSTNNLFQTDQLLNVLHNLSWILIGALLAMCLESSELLVVTNTSSITLSISGIFKEVCTIYLAIIWNHNKMNMTNSIGLAVCLFGIVIHVFIKVREQLVLQTISQSSQSQHENLVKLTSSSTTDSQNNYQYSPLLVDEEEWHQKY